jgi:hypothetical protein
LSLRKKQKKVKGRHGGLELMAFEVPRELYMRFKLRALRERVTHRALATAFVTAYVKGEFELEETKSDAKTEG